ncbi:Hypothetical_protein [Hexamita inflata]|uniref:Hypothetical_protein n=1 Tax=Hexamita inflata TaxID=28002 RepID=A0AA86R6Z2_9EUKA|nr:Hypothetical protein HINF_LOCUS54862 [Hexamita inflata]
MYNKYSSLYLEPLLNDPEEVREPEMPIELEYHLSRVHVARLIRAESPQLSICSPIVTAVLGRGTERFAKVVLLGFVFKEKVPSEGTNKLLLSKLNSSCMFYNKPTLQMIRVFLCQLYL